jgi:hypothetical protein
MLTCGARGLERLEPAVEIRLDLKSGITYMQISRIERGEAEPHPGTVRKLAVDFDVTPIDPVVSVGEAAV